MSLWITPVHNFLVCFPLLEGYDNDLLVALIYNHVNGLMFLFALNLPSQVWGINSLTEVTNTMKYIIAYYNTPYDTHLSVLNYHLQQFQIN